MRCFVSINIPREVARDIKKIQEKLPEFQGKKTELENLHLTLKFLGKISEDKIKKIKDRLRKSNLKSFETKIKYLGFFDNQKHGVVWLYLSNCDALQKQIDNRLKDLFEPERRFMSHLTIARTKSIKDKRKFLEELKKIEIPTIKFKVENFYLMKSELTSKDTTYKIIEEYKLI